ncbi:site-2 protease family protein [Thiomicrorhabdus sp. Milos-T2]|uniref:site-2 protease family protein n=1 Tax=Thiomicrorhabdus sp. Milos-T2 TaxID=90814 RepID=UPI000494D6FE|nr:site-2 protease family protein [Thiomicrorhabdus sp. Milos-T2]
MSVTLFSPSWHKVAHLKPRLRSHVEINRHVYRAKVWYVIKDDATGQFHRFTPEAYSLIGLMNGKRSLDDIWYSAGDQLGDDMPSQDEVIQLLSQLHKVDAIQADVIPDVSEMNDRRRKDKKNKALAVLKSPLALKIPLIDPEPFLNRTAGLSRFIFNIPAGIIWLIAILWALSQALVHWSELTENLADRVLAAENLILIWLIYPFVKLIHEMGHAYAVKRWGGQVHEMGIMFLIFMPVPYVDASASAAFRNKYQRMLVAGAGIIVEAFIAAIAMAVWVYSEPGIVRSIAFNALLIAGVSTLLFNGNPLLRFDAYYVLADYLEIPSLAQRGNKYIAYLWKRYLFSFEDEMTPAHVKSENGWLAFYALASFVYRVFITFTIVLFVISELFFIGVLLGILALYNMFGKPSVAILKYLMMDKKVQKNRGRVATVIGLFLLAILVLLFIIPVPRMTVAHGIIWAPEESRIITESNGFIKDIEVKQGERVKKNQVLLKAENTNLNAEIEESVGRVKELMARYQAAIGVESLNEAEIIARELAQSKKELARGVEELEALNIKSPNDGTFYLTLVDPLDKFIPRGTLIGYVLKPGEYRIRAVVGQDDVESVRNDVKSVEVRTAEKFNRVMAASLTREVPSAQKELPSLALSVEGGGEFALDPSSQEQVESFDPVFLFELRLKDGQYRIGERVYVRFEHSPEPIGYRIYRGIRRTLLRELEF